jgi:hypothetical protein
MQIQGSDRKKLEPIDINIIRTYNKSEERQEHFPFLACVRISSSKLYHTKKE